MLALVTMQMLLRAKYFQCLAIPCSLRALHKDYRTVVPQDFSNYESMKQDFKLEIPEYFNFAKDVLDQWTNMEKAGKRPSNPAFWWINGNGEEVRWGLKNWDLFQGNLQIYLQKPVPCKGEIKNYKFKSLKHCVSAGESINSEVTEQWRNRTGLDIYEGYGQTETVLICGNFKGMKIKPGSMGSLLLLLMLRFVHPFPGKYLTTQSVYHLPHFYSLTFLVLMAMFYHLDKKEILAFEFYLTNHFTFLHIMWLDHCSNPVKDNPTETASTPRGNFCITGDGAIWMMDISSLLQEWMISYYPLELAVISSPDPIRGEKSNDQEQLKKEIHERVKRTTAPYKYPRKAGILIMNNICLVEFIQELPKTISGKTKRNELRKKEWETI
ncbi:hypothetical protein E2I00_011466 [Balaenoptera physalus]|uniref:medium-chain acyl-CoA ligase n=1 Tax=Balaenoptera physalus TaxID=9770 RepID=A0A6A1QDT5_BALPH|nr:hypothetical protein E2I00_011466 [Balaenoptera physalus]